MRYHFAGTLDTRMTPRNVVGPGTPTGEEGLECQRPQWKFPLQVAAKPCVCVLLCVLLCIIMCILSFLQCSYFAAMLSCLTVQFTVCYAVFFGRIKWWWWWWWWTDIGCRIPTTPNVFGLLITAVFRPVRRSNQLLGCWIYSQERSWSRDRDGLPVSGQRPCETTKATGCGQRQRRSSKVKERLRKQLAAGSVQEQRLRVLLRRWAARAGEELDRRRLWWFWSTRTAVDLTRQPGSPVGRPPARNHRPTTNVVKPSRQQATTSACNFGAGRAAARWQTTVDFTAATTW